jgi:hypothetical protein
MRAPMVPTVLVTLGVTPIPPAIGALSLSGQRVWGESKTPAVRLKTRTGSS